MGSVAAVRAGDGWFTIDELIGLFDGLRLPRPAYPVPSLGQLRKSMLCPHALGRQLGSDAIGLASERDP